MMNFRKITQVFLRLILFCSSVSIYKSNGEEISRPIQRNKNALTECGQTLNANSGTIEYKLNQTYDAGELCVFILRHNISTNPGFRFLLESHGIGEFDRNSITIFTLQPDLVNSLHMNSTTDYLGPPYLDPLLNLAGSVAVVIFKPRTNSGTGFKLSFEATGDPESVEGNNIGLDSISNDEQSVTQYGALSNCTAPSCADVFVMTPGKMLIIDPAFFFKISFTMNTLPPQTREETCLNIFAVQDQTFERLTWINDCWSEHGDPKEYVFDTRGLFIAVISYIPGSKATGSISLEKVPDPEHELIYILDTTVHNLEIFGYNTN